MTATTAEAVTGPYFNHHRDARCERRCWTVTVKRGDAIITDHFHDEAQAKGFADNYKENR